jgi:hypothetical protein
MRTPIIAFFTILFLIVGLILLSWFISNLHDAEAVFLTHHGLEMNVSQDLPTFDRKEDQDHYYLTYGWTDFNGHSQNISFPLSKGLLMEAEDEFGYFPADLRKHLDDRLEMSRENMIEDLKKFVENMIQKSKYPEYILIEKSTAKSFSLKLSVPPALHKKVKREFDRIKAKLAKEQEKYLKRMEKEQEEERKRFLENRGIRLLNGKIGVNHSYCVMKNKDRIRPIFEIMQENYRNLSLHQFLGLLLAFIQDIRFYIPPLRERGKIILSYWVPPRVLADNFGDCDSKGVTFSSLWTNFKKYPLLLITVPKHFFVGLAIPSFTGEGLVVNGMRFTLCEVTGPGKMPPGMIGRYSQVCLQNGQYMYELIN